MIFITDRKLPELTIYNNLLDSWSIGHSGTFTSSESIFILWNIIEKYGKIIMDQYL
jgi:hypothetical protein